MLQAKVTIEVFGQKVELPFLVDIPGKASLEEVDFATMAVETMSIEAEEFVEAVTPEEEAA